VSYTTRYPRGDERDGVDYFFISRADFEERVARGEFLNTRKSLGITTVRTLWAGSSRRRGLRPGTRHRRAGCATIKRENSGRCVDFHFGAKPADPGRAAAARSQDSEAVILRRLHDAAGEIRNYSLYDYVLVNREVAASVETLVAIVKATRSRRDRMEDEIRPILETFS
jgi:guanylate kinase